MTKITQAYNWLSSGNPITGGMIAGLIRENAEQHDRQELLYERYKGTDEGVPVLTREFPVDNYSKINNKLANDFFGDIVNTKVGYFAGKPISYKYVETGESGEVLNTIDVDTLLQGFIKRNQTADLDSETAKMAAIAGMAARLCYINTNGDAAVINIPPWECVFIADEIGITDAPYAIRYYITERAGKTYTKAEFYDDKQVSYWVMEDTGDNSAAFVMDPEEPDNPAPHFMSGCPVCAFPNNEELLGDADRVLSLIDGYDRTLSDVNSEIEQFRLAYFVMTGMSVSDEQLDKLRQTCAISIPDADSNAQFITKNLNDVAIENHLLHLEENILRFAQTVRFTDESFGQASGVAMKFKLFNLESKCMMAERKFTKALYHQFAVLKGYFEARGISYDPWNLEFGFVRNFPLNLLDEAQTLATLKGLVSDTTAYSQMSFIDDPEKEIELLKAETDEYNQAQAELAAAIGYDYETNTKQPQNV